jgi:hypothetical protein
MYAGFANHLHTSATPDRTLVMSRGKRFESARWLSPIGVDKPIIRNERNRGLWLRAFLTPP